MRLRQHQGFTLTELVLSVGILSLFALGTANLFKWRPTPTLQKMVQQADFQRDLNRITQTVSDDLRGADPLSINWTLLPSTSTLSFKVARYDFIGAAGLPSPSIQYLFRAGDNPAFGNLVRIADGQETILLQGMDAPTIGTWLFDTDPVLPQIIILSISCRAKGLVSPWTQRIVIKS